MPQKIADFNIGIVSDGKQPGMFDIKYDAIVTIFVVVVVVVVDSGSCVQDHDSYSWNRWTRETKGACEVDRK